MEKKEKEEADKREIKPKTKEEGTRIGTFSRTTRMWKRNGTIETIDKELSGSLHRSRA